MAPKNVTTDMDIHIPTTMATMNLYILLGNEYYALSA